MAFFLYLILGIPAVIAARNMWPYGCSWALYTALSAGLVLSYFAIHRSSALKSEISKASAELSNLDERLAYLVSQREARFGPRTKDEDHESCEGAVALIGETVVEKFVLPNGGSTAGFGAMLAIKSAFAAIRYLKTPEEERTLDRWIGELEEERKTLASKLSGLETTGVAGSMVLALILAIVFYSLPSATV